MSRQEVIENKQSFLRMTNTGHVTEGEINMKVRGTDEMRYKIVYITTSVKMSRCKEVTM